MIPTKPTCEVLALSRAMLVNWPENVQTDVQKGAYVHSITGADCTQNANATKQLARSTSNVDLPA
jgi:hypothetical protein